MSGPAGTPGPVPPEPDEHGDPPDRPFADLDDADLDDAELGDAELGDAELGDAELGELVLVPGSEPVPTERLLIAEPAGPGGGVGGGLCWSFDVDLDAIQASAAKASAAGILPGLAAAGRGGAAAGGTTVPGAAASPGGPAPAQGQEPGGSPGPGNVLLPDEGGLGLDVAAEFLPGSAGLAAWLDQRDPADNSDYDLPAVAAGWRRVAAWAQAREFAAIAQIATRSAARNEKVGLEEDGRPAAVTLDAAAQVGLALVLSPGTAEWWTGQAITLTWRLPGTGAALAAGRIDAYRARLIIEATGLLEEDAARAVEGDVLAEAGELTYAQLRSRLRKAVIIADPEGAEERRKAAERRARVSLYPDDDGTATLTGTSLPGPHAAAAMARITALARALKASGAGGGTDLLRAHIFLGLLLGTLPPIPPPADGGQPDGPTHDDPPPDDDGGPGGTPDERGPGGAPGDGQPGSASPRHGQPGSAPPRHGRPGSTPPGGSQHPGTPRGSRPSRRERPPGRPAPHRDEPIGHLGEDPPLDAPPSHRHEPAGSPAGDPPPSQTAASRPPGGDSRGPRPPGPHPPGPEPPAATPPGPSPVPVTAPGSTAPGSTAPGSSVPGSTLPGASAPGTLSSGPAGDDGSAADLWPGVPPLTDADAPDPDGHADPLPEPEDDDRLRYGEDPLDLPDTGPLPAWPTVPGTTGTVGDAATRAAAGVCASGSAGGADVPISATGDGTAGSAASAGRPTAGMLDLTLSWATFAESASAPGFLGRIGPVTATQARALAAAARTAPGTRWRVILTDDNGHAIKTATVTRQPGARAWPARGPAAGSRKASDQSTATSARPTEASARLTEATEGPPRPKKPTARPKKAMAQDKEASTWATKTTTRAIDAMAGSPGTAGPMLPLAGPVASITGRVSVTSPVAALGQLNAAELAGTSVRAAILRAAAKAAARMRWQTITDREADAGCAHTTASPAYRPPLTIRDLVEARDQTCRFPGCRQPAWRGDLDHTVPFHCGGLTCPCNLGPLCRRHHRLKQQRHWALTQNTPGTFHWQTPAGRSHATTAHRHVP